MSLPTEPCARIASVEAVIGVDAIEFRSPFTFLHSEHREALADELGAIPLASIVTSFANPGSDTKVPSEKAARAFVVAQIAATIDSAPSALDTLNELAAALNDDANFAATMMTALSAKAPLASPAFTDTPTAPTPSTPTDSTQIATTAFVHAVVTAATGDIDGGAPDSAYSAGGIDGGTP